MKNLVSESKKRSNDSFNGQKMGIRFCLVSLAILLVIGLTGCAAVDERSQGQLNAAYGPNPPVIIASYAAKTIAPGDTWKVYVKAEDPDGDMKYISIWVETSADFIPAYKLSIKPDERRLLSGYLTLNSMEFAGPRDSLLQAYIRLRVHIEDEAHHKSEEIHHTLQFAGVATQPPPPPGVFAEHYLGRIPVPAQGIEPPPGTGGFKVN